MGNSVYMLQSSFTAGEISSDVASRVDLNKYQSALLKAHNVYVRPYGGVYRRPGTIYHGQAKFNNKKVRLLRFNFTEDSCYLLEVGEGYIRVWHDGKYLDVELEVPFAESDLPNLRYVQSADVMYICSQRLPVQMLMRYSETDWRIEEFKPTTSPFDSVNLDEENTLTPSGTTGNITLTMSKETFDSSLVGADIKIAQEIKEQVVVTGSNGATNAYLCGRSWSLVTRGTWSGNMTLQKSTDGTTWENIRIYNSSNDYNASDNGTVDEPTYLRLVLAISGGGAATLTIYRFTHEAIVKVTDVIDNKTTQADVISPLPIGLANTKPTDLWYLSSWNGRYGYPMCATFFQDRLVFAGSVKQPNVIWMSKTGDYYNFGVEKVDGTITDDSSIQVPIISRDFFAICHLVPGQDLVILTAGNEWIISGSSVVTPTSLNPKMQTARGSSEVEPQFIGNQIVYVQRRGSTVRNTGYSYESDGYDGTDLTLLAKHLIYDNEIIDSAYAQEPDSIIYFVRDDGKIICLTCLLEQEVYAWAQLETDGEFENAVRIPTGNRDIIYVSVKREIDGQVVRYIESFAPKTRSNSPVDHLMVDCAIRINNLTKNTKVSGLEHLKGKMVQVTADNLILPENYFIVDDNGEVELPDLVQNVNVGLPYMVQIETTNIDIEGRAGFTLGRPKTVAEAILNLENSFGGLVGIGFDYVEDQIFREESYFANGLTLYTGNLKVPIPRDTNDTGKVTIRHNSPYPFTLNSIVRKVDFK